MRAYSRPLLQDEAQYKKACIWFSYPVEVFNTFQESLFDRVITCLVMKYSLQCELLTFIPNFEGN